MLLSDPGDFAGMNEECAHWFPSDSPARYAAKLGAEIPGLLISIHMTASLAKVQPIPDGARPFAA